MARILVLYGTTDGHTQKVAQFISATLRVQGADVDVIQAGTLDPHPEDYAGIIVAASVRGGRYQRPVAAWVRKHGAALADKTTAFVSVCLAVLQSDAKVQQEVSDRVSTWLAGVGWLPTFSKPVAGALLYTRYNWFIRQIMKRIVRKAGGSTDTTRDHVYTNWHDLRRFTEQFGRTVNRAETAHLHDVA